jgi:LysR family transcriptional regulator, mexEF-oprN operon transcriptional activator
MSDGYGRDLDLNLLRVFVVVATTRSVTQAAAKLYLTQPAISAALRRLQTALGAALFARRGRGLVLTARGERLLAAVRPHLAAIIDATLTLSEFDPKTSDRVVRVGLSDAMEGWLLPRLLHALASSAPHFRVVAVPVQFRTVGAALASGSVDLAVTVADELPPNARRQALFHEGFVCVFDPRRLKLKRRVSEREYFACEHVIVSYNGDLRGVVEDAVHKQRSVRCSVAGFSHLGAIVENSSLLATVPSVVARHLLAQHPRLRSAALPFRLVGTPLELIWPLIADNDPACELVRDELVRICKELAPGGD